MSPAITLTSAIAVVIAVAVTVPLLAQRVAKRVFVRAVDAGGAPVLDLTAADFQITENDARREVTRATLGTAPMRIVLLVDSSNAASQMMNTFRAALNGLVDAIPAAHEIALVSTGGQIRIRTQPSTDRDKLKAEIARFATEGGANAFLETMLEADRRFLKTVPAQWPVFVIVTTDNGSARSEPDFDRYNRFMNDFLSRGGSAHAMVVAGRQTGPVSDLAKNLVENVGGIFESLVTDSTLPERLSRVGERLAIDHGMMHDRYEVEFSSDANVLKPTVNVGVTRNGLRLQMSPRRPF